MFVAAVERLRDLQRMPDDEDDDAVPSRSPLRQACNGSAMSSHVPLW